MITRELSIQDIDAIKECVTSNTKIYGVDMNYEKIMSNIQHHLLKEKVYGCYDNDNQCVAISTQRFWKAMPVWVMSNFYIKNTIKNSYLGFSQTAILCNLMEESIKYAETLNCYEFYYVIRDTSSAKRKKYIRSVLDEITPTITKRYEFENIHFLKTESDIKWPYINAIIGDIGINFLKKSNNKVLVVRRGRLKRDAREVINNVWLPDQGSNLGPAD